MKFEPAVATDLSLLFKVISPEASESVGEGAAQDLIKLRNIDYVGILRQFLDSEHSVAILAESGAPGCSDTKTCLLALQKQIEKTNNKVYMETDSEAFQRAAIQVCNMCGSATQDRSLHKQVVPLLELMKVRAKICVTEMNKELRGLFEHLATAPGQDVIEYTQAATARNHAAKDLVLKSCTHFAAVLKQVPALQTIEIFAGPCRELAEQAEHLHAGTSAIDLANKINTANISSRGSVPTSKQANELLVHLSEVRGLLDNFGPDAATVTAWQAFEQRFNAGTGGAELYKQKLQDFRADATKLIEVFLPMEENLGGGRLAVTQAMEQLDRSSHALSQTLIWSDAPIYATTCVQFANDVVVNICSHAHIIYQWGECVPKDFVPDAGMNIAIEKAMAREESTPKLVWLLGDPSSSNVPHERTPKYLFFGKEIDLNLNLNTNANLF